MALLLVSTLNSLVGQEGVAEDPLPGMDTVIWSRRNSIAKNGKGLGKAE